MADEKAVVALLGKSGCGKDTQGELLVEKYGFSMINSGVILRGISASIPSLEKESLERYEAEEIRNLIDAGFFVPTITIVYHWVKPLLEKMKNHSNVKGIVFTGSPRKLAEAILIRDFFLNWADAKENFRLIPLELTISDSEVFARLSHRRQCGKCKKIFSASKEHMALTACDKCGGELIKREDDSPDGIKSRMKEYNDYVVPVLKYFEEEHLLKNVNGERSIEDVHKGIVQTLGL